MDKADRKNKNPQNLLVFLEWLTMHYEPLSECLFAFSVKNENLNIPWFDKMMQVNRIKNNK